MTDLNLNEINLLLSIGFWYLLIIIIHIECVVTELFDWSRWDKKQKLLIDITLICNPGGRWSEYCTVCFDNVLYSTVGTVRTGTLPVLSHNSILVLQVDYVYYCTCTVQYSTVHSLNMNTALVLIPVQ